jgi:hypothetical protein
MVKGRDMVELLDWRSHLIIPAKGNTTYESGILN